MLILTIIERNTKEFFFCVLFSMNRNIMVIYDSNEPMKWEKHFCVIKHIFRF